MSDNGTQTGNDTRPAFMLDPTLTEVDEAAIAAIGQSIEDNLTSDVAGQFLNRISDDGSATGDGASTVESDQPSGAPAAGETVVPAAGATDTPQPDPTPTVFTVPVPGIDPNTGQAYAPVQLNQEQALQLLREHAFYTNQAPEIQEAWGSIHQGTHQAVSNQEYAQFAAWKAAGSPAKPTQRPVDLEDLPDEAVKYIQDLEARSTTEHVNAGINTQVSLTPAQLMQQQQEMVNRQVAVTQALQSVRDEYKQTYGIDDAQLTQLETVVAQSGVIATLNQRHRQMVGNIVVAEADPNIVMREAFEYGMTVDPRFRTLRDDHQFQARLEREKKLNADVNSKKALASSLAHTPSAAVPSNQGSKPLAQMTPQERSQFLNSKMIEELTELIANGQAAQ